MEGSETMESRVLGSNRVENKTMTEEMALLYGYHRIHDVHLVWLSHQLVGIKYPKFWIESKSLCQNKQTNKRKNENGQTCYSVWPGGKNIFQ